MKKRAKAFLFTVGLATAPIGGMAISSDNAEACFACRGFPQLKCVDAVDGWASCVDHDAKGNYIGCHVSGICIP